MDEQRVARDGLWTASVVASPDALAQELPDGELIFLHLGTEEYFGLDPVGTAMYRRLIGSSDVAGAHAGLLEEFDVSPERLRADVEALLDELVARGLVELRAP